MLVTWRILYHITILVHISAQFKTESIKSSRHPFKKEINMRDKEHLGSQNRGADRLQNEMALNAHPSRRSKNVTEFHRNQIPKKSNLNWNNLERTKRNSGSEATTVPYPGNTRAFWFLGPIAWSAQSKKQPRTRAINSKECDDDYLRPLSLISERISNDSIVDDKRNIFVSNGWTASSTASTSGGLINNAKSNKKTSNQQDGSRNAYAFTSNHWGPLGKRAPLIHEMAEETATQRVRAAANHQFKALKDAFTFGHWGPLAKLIRTVNKMTEAANLNFPRGLAKNL